MWSYLLAGGTAGAVAGLFGAGGGLVLVPLLRHCKDLPTKSLFPSSVAVILPICVVSILTGAIQGQLYLKEALPYLLGSTLGGGIAAGIVRKIPVQWLHRGLGILILWGGVRNLC